MSNIVKENCTVAVHYIGTLEDGSVFDSSREAGQPFSFETGTGSVVPGFNDAVVGMELGETKTVVLTPANAYGIHNENAFQVVPKSKFSPDFDFSPGNSVAGQSNGQNFRAIIEGTTENHVVINFNHPLAGKTLTFEIEVIEITEKDIEVIPDQALQE